MKLLFRLGLSATLLAAFTAGPATAAGVCRFTPPATAGRASNVFDRLVGLAVTGQRGLGGTGVLAQREERGLGGTGILGVVTGFGSICVNGFEVELPRSAPVLVAGLPAAAGDLRLGQVVVLEADTRAAGLQATRVNITVAVAGPVAAIAADRTSLTVAGQTVAVTGFGGSAGVGDVRPGDWVVVSGLRRADDSIAGTSIVKLPRHGRQVFLSGTTRAAAGTVEIGDLVIASSTPVTAGETVAVRGTLSGATLQALALEVETASPFSRPLTNLSVQGYGVHVASELQRMGVTPPATVTGSPAIPVQVDGSFGVTGAFAPLRIETPTAPADGATPAPPTFSVQPSNAAPVQAPSTSAPASAAPAAPRPLPPDGAPRPPGDRPAAPPDLSRPATPDRPAPPVRPDRPAPPDRPLRPDPPRP